MNAIVSVPLAALFVFVAAFNAWIMLTSVGKSSRTRRLWTQTHRICGYAFIALFVIFCYFMLIRIKGSSDDLSPRLVLHMGLALILGPLLLAKVIVVRYQKAAWGLLMALGISIFVTAFTLVTLNVSVHYLCNASTHKIPFSTSFSVVMLTVTLALAALFTRGKPPKPRPNTATVSAEKPIDRESSKQTFETLKLTLARIEPQTADAKTLRFLLPQGQHLSARPGQFLTFQWPIDGRAVVRSYSICSSPAQTGYIEITPKRVENGCVSTFLNDQASVGLTVKARGPYGKFYFDESIHRRIVLIAGGSGITPMMAMLRYIDDLCIPVDITLIYCVRTEKDVLFKEELATLKDRLSSFRCVLVLSRPGSAWEGWKGHLRPEILERELEKPSESTMFLCGPPAFMELVRTLLKDMKIDSSKILQESFGGVITGEKHSPGAGLLEMRFSSSAVTYKVSPDQTLLESSEENGLMIPYGCRQGICGTCATRLLRGRVRMEPEEALNAELRSQGVILPCISRPLCDVTLDA